MTLFWCCFLVEETLLSETTYRYTGSLPVLLCTTGNQHHDIFDAHICVHVECTSIVYDSTRYLIPGTGPSPGTR